MKKLFLIATILAGAVGVSQAGVNFSIGIGLPVPPPVIISRPAPVYVAPCPPAVVVGPRYYYPPPVVVHRYPVYPVRPAYRHDNWRHHDNRGHSGHWDNHHR